MSYLMSFVYNVKGINALIKWKVLYQNALFRNCLEEKGVKNKVLVF